MVPVLNEVLSIMKGVRIQAYIIYLLIFFIFLWQIQISINAPNVLNYLISEVYNLYLPITFEHKKTIWFVKY